MTICKRITYAMGAVLALAAAGGGAAIVLIGRAGNASMGVLRAGGVDLQLAEDAVGAMAGEMRTALLLVFLALATTLAATAAWLVRTICGPLPGTSACCLRAT